MVGEKEVLAALARVPGPDGATPLPQSGAIVGVTSVGDKIYVSISVDPAMAARLEPMRRSAEAVVKQLPGVGAAVVTLTADRPTGASRPTDPSPGPRAQAAQRQTDIPGVARIIAVASGKGGVGKSTTAANLALGLSTLGWRVGVLDADVYGPSIPRLFGLSGKPESDGKTIFPMRAHGVKVMSIGFLVDEKTAMIWRGPMVQSALTQMMRDVAWGELDCLVVDMPPGTGDAQLTMAQTVPLKGVVVVSTPQDLALIDARRAIAMFEKVQTPILGVVENMSYFLCPHCGGRSDIFAHGGARHEAEKRGAPFLGEVPLDMAIRETSDDGRPIVATDPASPHARAYVEIARRVMERLADAPARAFPRIVIE